MALISKKLNIGCLGNVFNAVICQSLNFHTHTNRINCSLCRLLGSKAKSVSCSKISDETGQLFFFKDASLAAKQTKREN